MTHAAREVSRFGGQPVDCYRFAHGSEVWRLTTSDVPQTLPDGTYVPEALVAGPIRRSEEWDSGSMTITLDYLHPIARLFQASRPREPVLVTAYTFHRGESEFPIKFQGEVAMATATARAAVLQCVPSTYRLKKRVPVLIYSSRCPLALYGDRCGVNRAAFRDRVTIGAVNGAEITAAALGARANGWYVNGYVQTLQGETRFVIRHVGGLIELEYPLPVVAGQQLDVFAGCDRSESTCRSKFSNIENHLGFARIPVKELFGGAVD